MEVCKAFNIYFLKLKELYGKVFGTLPTVPYDENNISPLYKSIPDEDGEVEWLPIRATYNPNWEKIERIFGFCVCDEIKSYYSSYRFLQLTGTYNGMTLYFIPFDIDREKDNAIRTAYAQAKFHFPNKHYFLLGVAEYCGDDEYLIFYDNDLRKVLCQELDTNNCIEFSESLSQIITSMEAII